MAQRVRTGSGAIFRLVWLASSGLFTLSAGCGDDIGSKRPGEPCTRSDQCMQDLECTDGVCRDPSDGGADSASEN
jgi:hypothetical protein